MVDSMALVFIFDEAPFLVIVDLKILKVIDLAVCLPNYLLSDAECMPDF